MMELKGILVDMLDCVSEVKIFDEMKMGVKGFVEVGMIKIFCIFYNLFVFVIIFKFFLIVRILIIDFRGGVFDFEVM